MKKKKKKVYIPLPSDVAQQMLWNLPRNIVKIVMILQCKYYNCEMQFIIKNLNSSVLVFEPMKSIVFSLANTF